MKNLYDPESKADIMYRLHRLEPKSKRKWGTMSAPQMLAHCRIQLQLALGEVEGKVLLNAPLRYLLLLSIKFPMNWPHGLPSANEMKVVDTQNFERERALLSAAIDRFIIAQTWDAHPLFGDMSQDQWGLVAYKHLDHHLRQFGG